MIQPNELRIGNLVTVNNQEYYASLKDISLRITGIYENSNGYIVNLEHIKKTQNTYYESYSQKIKFVEPIPLTEEMLLKCGFEWIDSGHSEDHEDYHKWLEKVYDVFGCVFKWDDYVIWEQQDDIKIYYLHQLQNLFFSITGKELEIKL